MVVWFEQCQGFDVFVGLDDQFVVFFDVGIEGGQQGVFLVELWGDQFGIVMIDIDEVEIVVFYILGFFVLFLGNDQFDGNVY